MPTNRKSQSKKETKPAVIQITKKKYEKLAGVINDFRTAVYELNARLEHLEDNLVQMLAKMEIHKKKGK